MSKPPARPAPPRQFRRWSPAEIEILTELAATRTPNKIIAERLGRSVFTVAVRRSEQALTQRPEHCEQCGGRIEQAPRGRPRRFCTLDCAKQASNERGTSRRSIERAAAIAARTDWTCAAEGCQNQLPGDRPKQKYCSRRCAVRTNERAYAPIRAARQKQRSAAAAATRPPRTPRPKTSVAQVIGLMDAAGQPNDLGGAGARTWVRHVAGIPTPSEVICLAIRERKARDRN